MVFTWYVVLEFVLLILVFLVPPFVRTFAPVSLSVPLCFVFVSFAFGDLAPQQCILHLQSLSPTNRACARIAIAIVIHPRAHVHPPTVIEPMPIAPASVSASESELHVFSYYLFISLHSSPPRGNCGLGLGLND